MHAHDAEMAESCDGVLAVTRKRICKLLKKHEVTPSPGVRRRGRRRNYQHPCLHWAGARERVRPRAEFTEFLYGLRRPDGAYANGREL